MNQSRSGLRSSRPPVAPDVRWVWRGIRARGWRAVFIVLLFGVALAANAVVFSAADAFVLRTAPYYQPDRLAIIERVDRRTSDYIRPAAFSEWRNHRDLFAGVHAHAWGRTAYLTTGGITETVRAEQVTPGLFELLGVLPVWGRPFTNGDATAGAPPVAIIGESLARRLFADPSAAIGQTFFTGSETLTVVGVMPASFRFPTAREEIWRPLDLATWPDNSGIRNVARLAPGHTIRTAARAVADRAAGVVAQLTGPRPRNESMRLRSMADVRGNPQGRTLFPMLVAAATCLLLIACANVASLELAGATRRMRVYAVQAALGASRSSLIRIGLLEGAVLLAASAGTGLALTHWGTSVLVRQLTPAMREALTNPLDVDPRVMLFMLAVAAFTWMITSLPVIRRISRLSILDGLRDDPRTMPVSGAAARTRQWLMAGQVALTTLLLVGALLYVRTYAAKIGLDKGFDASNIATIQVSPAPDLGRSQADLEAEILERLRATPGVRAVSRTDALPPATQSGGTAPLTIEGREPTAERVMIHMRDVDPEYFRVMDIAVVEGRAFDASTPRDQILVDERFARRYWPNASPIGARFRLGGVGFGGVSSFQIAGVTRQLRADRLTSEEGDEVYVAHIRISPTYHPLTFVARLDTDRRLGELGAIVRSMATRSVVRIDTVEARYSRLEGDTRLAAAVTGGFGITALIVATSGIYAVMAFLVAGRSKEIAIRMALGADRGQVQRLVVRSSLQFVVTGLAVGLAVAALASQAIESQLFGVSRLDAATYAGVSALVIAAALASTWRPMRRAARVDPAVTLRAE